MHLFLTMQAQNGGPFTRTRLSSRCSRWRPVRHLQWSTSCRSFFLCHWPPAPPQPPTCCLPLWSTQPPWRSILRTRPPNRGPVPMRTRRTAATTGFDDGLVLGPLSCRAWTSGCHARIPWFALSCLMFGCFLHEF